MGGGRVQVLQSWWGPSPAMCRSPLAKVAVCICRQGGSTTRPGHDPAAGHPSPASTPSPHRGVPADLQGQAAPRAATTPGCPAACGLPQPGPLRAATPSHRVTGRRFHQGTDPDSPSGPHHPAHPTYRRPSSTSLWTCHLGPPPGSARGSACLCPHLPGVRPALRLPPPALLLPSTCGPSWRRSRVTGWEGCVRADHTDAWTPGPATMVQSRGSHVHTRGLGGGLFPPPERPQQQAGPLANPFPRGQDSCPPCAPWCPGPGPRAGNAARAACVSVLSKRPFPASLCGVCDRGICLKHCRPPAPSPACWPTQPRRRQLLAPQRPKGRVQCMPRAPTQAHGWAVRAPGEGAPFS